MSLSRRQLATRIRENHNLTLKEAHRVIDTVTDAVTETLVKGEEVRLQGFASLKVMESKARKVNPAFGGECPAKKRVRFRAGKDLKASINR